MKTLDIKSKLVFFEQSLIEEDKSVATIKKYVGDIRIFTEWCSANCIEEVSNQVLQAYRAELLSRRKINGCNSVIISLNNFFRRYAKEEKLYVKIVKTERRTSLDCIFSEEEYHSLLEKSLEIGNKRLFCIMKVLANTGIRISELAFVTVETLSTGMCTVINKGKARKIYIPKPVCILLQEYCNANKITSGMIFHSRQFPNKMIDKSQIWRELKHLEKLLGLPEGCVHAHNFRHFFAKQYINKYYDLCDLADILGHSSIETTRVYTRTTQSEKRQRIEELNL